MYILFCDCMQTARNNSYKNNTIESVLKRFSDIAQLSTTANEEKTKSKNPLWHNNIIRVVVNYMRCRRRQSNYYTRRANFATVVAYVNIFHLGKPVQMNMPWRTFRSTFLVQCINKRIIWAYKWKKKTIITIMMNCVFETGRTLQTE